MFKSNKFVGIFLRVFEYSTRNLCNLLVVYHMAMHNEIITLSMEKGKDKGGNGNINNKLNNRHLFYLRSQLSTCSLL